MNDTGTNYRDKGRAVLLTAIMVLSVVAMTAAFTGGGAALADASINVSDVTLSQDTTNDDATYSIDVGVNGDIDNEEVDGIRVDLDAAEVFTSPDASSLSASDVSVTGATVASVDASSTNGIADSDSDTLEIELSGTESYSDGDTVTIELDGVTNPSNTGDGDVRVEFTDDVAADPGPNAETDLGSNIYSISPSFVVTNVDAPDVAFHGQDFDVEATIENQGASAGDVDVIFGADAAAGNVESGSPSEDFLRGPTTLSLSAGESTTVPLSLNSDTDYGSLTNASNVQDIWHGIYLEDSNTGNFEDGAEVPFKVGTDDEGTVTVTVEDLNNNRLEDATVELLDASGSVLRTQLTNEDGVARFERLALGPNEDNPVDYGLTAEKQEFTSGQAEVNLYTDPAKRDNDDVTVPITLTSDLDPNVLGVGAVTKDSNGEWRVVNNRSALFANGEFDQQATFAVFTQTQSKNDPTLTDSSVVADLVAANRTGDAPLEFVTDQVNDLSSQRIQLEINETSPTTNIDGDSRTGEFNYRLFNITAENATDGVVDPLRTEDFFVWSDDIETEQNSTDNFMVSPDLVDPPDPSPAQRDDEPPLAQITDQPTQGPVNHNTLFDNYGSTGADFEAFRRDSNGGVDSVGFEGLLGDVFYFVEGDKSTGHEVWDVTNNSPIVDQVNPDDVKVWAAYVGGPQDYSDIESFKNANGESFLVAEHFEDETFVIDGLVADELFNVYVDVPGYNIFNSTVEGLPLTGDQFIADYTLNERIDGNQDGSGERYKLTHLLSETPQAYDLDVEVWEPDTQQWVKSAEIPDTLDATEVRVQVRQGDVGTSAGNFVPAANQDVTLDIVPRPNLAGDFTGNANTGNQQVTVTTNSTGYAKVDFEPYGGVSGLQNVSASVTNAAGTEYNTTVDDPRPYNNRANQSEIEVFTVGTITGDIVDDTDESENVVGADVFLFELNTTSGLYEYAGRQVTSGEDGSYRFEDVSTAETYQVVSNQTFEINGVPTEFEGFNTNVQISAGTNGGIDVVLQDLDLDDVDSGNQWYTDYVNANDVVTSSGLNAAISDFLSGDLSNSRLNAVIASYLNGDPIDTSA